jgi:hypothetical protein
MDPEIVANVFKKALEQAKQMMADKYKSKFSPPAAPEPDGAEKPAAVEVEVEGEPGADLDEDKIRQLLEVLGGKDAAAPVAQPNEEMLGDDQKKPFMKPEDDQMLEADQKKPFMKK